MTYRLLPLTLLVLAYAAFAEEGTRPADFDHPEEDRRMDRLIQFPEVKGDLTVVLNCFSQIERSGKMETTGCYVENNYDQPFADAVTTAAKKARLNPAIIDGETKKVFLQFRAAFEAKGEDRKINFYLNPGYEENVKAYGIDHVAGQRAIGKDEPWMDVCPKRAEFAVWVRAYLGEDGKADNPTIEHADGIMPVAACRDAIGRTILASQYTPALADGEAVPSTFVEPFSN